LERRAVESRKVPKRRAQSCIEPIMVEVVGLKMGKNVRYCPARMKANEVLIVTGFVKVVGERLSVLTQVVNLTVNVKQPIKFEFLE
jgi:hypothetical protein